MVDNDLYVHVLELKEQILRFAPAKKHDSSDDTYGKGTSSKYGHVKVDNTVQTSENPPKGSAIITYVSEQINTVKTALKSELQSKINIITTSTGITNNTTEQTSNRYNIPTAKAIWDYFQPRVNIDTSISESSQDSTNNKNNIPTSKAVWDALSSYKNLLVGVDLSAPKSSSQDIDTLKDAGYYIMEHDTPKYFTYGGNIIYYKNALVKVQKQSNRVIQNVYTTEKIELSNNEITYKINGAEYRRYGTPNENEEIVWRPWHVMHIPYAKTSRAQNLINVDSIEVYENTAGYIIRWKQENDQQNSYVVNTPLYEYTDLCTFNPALPITGPYIFSNLIGRMDVKITADKMQIRSNIAPGGRIIQVNETYFVPRNQ